MCNGATWKRNRSLAMRHLRSNLAGSSGEEICQEEIGRFIERITDLSTNGKDVTPHLEVVVATASVLTCLLFGKLRPVNRPCLREYCVSRNLTRLLAIQIFNLSSIIILKSTRKCSSAANRELKRTLWNILLGRIILMFTLSTFQRELMNMLHGGSSIALTITLLKYAPWLGLFPLPGLKVVENYNQRLDELYSSLSTKVWWYSLLQSMCKSKPSVLLHYSILRLWD